MPRVKKFDVEIHSGGSVVGFRPLSDRARAWFRDNVQSEGWQWIGPILWVDHRLAGDLSEGIDDAGLKRQVQ